MSDHLKAFVVLVLAFNPAASLRSASLWVRSSLDRPSFASSFLDLLRSRKLLRHHIAATGRSVRPIPHMMELRPTTEVELATLFAVAMQHMRANDAQALRALLLAETHSGGSTHNGSSLLCMFADDSGRTLLHMAAAADNLECVRAVLDAWDAHEPRLSAVCAEVAAGPELWADVYGLCAGEYAFATGSQHVFDLLVDTACSRPFHVRTDMPADATENEYLESSLKYEGDILLDSNGNGVMMGWEVPLMKAHAEAVMPEFGHGHRVLNIGFGLGIVDGFLQERQPGHHVIVEAHPDVHAEMARRGWMMRANVTVLFGRWQDISAQIIAQGPYDGVFFDTWAEVGSDQLKLFRLMPRLLAPGGRFSWYNGPADSSSIFANAVQFRIQQMELEKHGLVCTYCPITFGEVGDDEWRKVSNKYWTGATYYLPVAVKMAVFDNSSYPGNVSSMPTAAEECGRVSAVQVGDELSEAMKGKLLRAWRADAKIGQGMFGFGDS